MKKMLFAFLVLLVSVTALFAADKEGGIIGTGVVGQITGLGNFEVSGMQFEIEQDVQVKGVSGISGLKMGMTLAVRATREGEDWFATDIRRVPVVVGPVIGDSTVMGIPVIGELPDAKRVSVDGFWSEAGIVATHIEVVSGGDDRITGPFDQIERVGELAILDPDAVPDDRSGIFTVTGTYEDGIFSANTLEKGLFSGKQPNLLMAEGFFSRPDASGETSLLGIDATRKIGTDEQMDVQTKSTRCAFNGRIDFEINDIAEDEQETVIALCANLPR